MAVDPPPFSPPHLPVRAPARYPARPVLAPGPCAAIDDAAHDLEAHWRQIIALGRLGEGAADPAQDGRAALETARAMEAALRRVGLCHPRYRRPL